MPLIPSTYRPPFGLRNPHAQTILRALLPAQPLPLSQNETLELADGDCLHLHWHLPHPASAPLAVLCHGLEGHAGARYMHSMAHALHRRHCNALTWSYRGCGAQPNRLARSYHSGATEDLAAVVEHALQEIPGPLLLIGFSLGGNLILKYLGERTPPTRLIAAAAISAPIDLSSCADALDLKTGNLLYRSRFLRSLNAKASQKAKHFPAQVAALNGSALRTVRAFDEAYTAPLHGFLSAADYYTRCSALSLLPNLSLPTLLLNASDDPLLAPLSHPTALAANHPHLHLETPAHGGHVAFLDPRRPFRSWIDQRVPDFLLTALQSAQNPPPRPS